MAAQPQVSLSPAEDFCSTLTSVWKDVDRTQCRAFASTASHPIPASRHQIAPAKEMAGSSKALQLESSQESNLVIDRKDFQLRPVFPVNVLVHDLSLKLDLSRSSLARLWPLSRVSNKKPCSGADGRSKLILDRIHARIPSGSVTAILGGSGSGKTSLLNVLSRRMRDKRLHETGAISFNGSTELASVRSAYVMQQDVLIPTLTVRETLEYAAQLRLPGETTATERRLVVEEVIQELGLQKCADTRIGDAEHGGCSGGEKRRVSLGVQLLSNPSVLFLDEVTTGLDAAGAYQLVRLLKQLAMRGRTIILTIHQPRSEIWAFFDQIVLLTEGSSIFSGAAGSALHHFDTLGYPIPPFVNPAEHLIDLAAVDSRSAELERTSRKRVDELKSIWNHSEKAEADSFSPALDFVPGGNDGQHVPQQGSSSFANRVKVQTSRTFKMAWRDPNGIAGSMVECLGMAVLTGWIFYGLDESQSGIRSREGSLYIASVLQSYLVLLYETYRLTLEVAVFDRENAEGVVDVWSFLLSRRIAKFAIEDLPVPLFYSAIVYFMTGFRADGTQFAIFCGFILLTHYVSVVLAAVAVALCRDFAEASLFVNMNLNLQALCCGFLVQTDQIPVYVEWLKWLAYAFYTTGALITNEFIGNSNSPSGHLYDCPFPGGASNPACAPWTGRFVTTLLGYPQTAWIWRPAVILVGFIAAFGIGAGLIFTFSKNELRLARARPFKHDTTYAADMSPKAVKLTPTNTLHVTLEDVSLDIETRNVLGRAKESKPILRRLRADFRPGILNVIIGVSGGGKSSLLNLVGRRLPNSPLRSYKSLGSIRIGGSELLDDTVRSLTSYVCQADDGLIPTLTVREMIDFSAQLRLPTEIPAHEKTQRAEQVLQRLGLRNCADHLIGNHLVKGISGGEKRRVSIAIQILAEPRILLLDEPTSGLDAFTASSILETLRGLAVEGTTVILTIHQARSDHFRHFGSVLLLAQGGVPVYSGTGEGMLAHFSSLGYSCPENMNPADFALDLISTDVQSSRTGHKTADSAKHLITAWDALQMPTVQCISQQSAAPLHPQSPAASCRPRVSTIYATRTLLHRSALSFVRSRPALMARTSQVLGFVILLTLFYAPLQYNYPGVQSHVGLLQQLLAVYFIGMLQNVAIFPDEQAVFRNEHRDRLYGVEPFFLSYSLLALPFDLVNSVLVGVLATFAVGLPRTGTVFGVVSFVAFALLSCGDSVGILFNAVFSSTGFAVSVISVVLSLGLVMSGVLSTGLTGFLAAINHVSPAKWAIAAMAPYTLVGQQFTCTAAERVGGACPIQTGEEVLQLYHLDPSGRMALVYLLVLTLGYRLLAYLLLKVVHKEVRLWGSGRARRKAGVSVC